MSETIQRFITRHTDLFREGRIDEMLDDCRFPLAIQDTQGMQVVKSRTQYRAWLQKWQDRLCRRQLVESVLTIRAVELPRDGRFRVWVGRLWENAKTGDQIDLSVIYYCRFSPEPMIEMIELDTLAPHVVGSPQGHDGLRRD